MRSTVRKALLALLGFNLFQVGCEMSSQIQNYENRIVHRGIASIILAALVVGAHAVVVSRPESPMTKAGKWLLAGILAATAVLLGFLLLLSFQM